MTKTMPTTGTTVEEGIEVDVSAEAELDDRKYFRKIIRITAEDSPNVKYAKEQIAAGITPTNEIITPGVLTYSLYRKRRRLWDDERQCVGLDARFWKGESTMLYPEKWLDLARIRAEFLENGRFLRKTEAVGIDPAEGGDSTTFSAVDRFGLLEQHGMKTRDTSVIVPYAIAMLRRLDLPPEQMMFDLGGGGKEHADLMRNKGYNVRTVGFGEGAQPQVRGRFYRNRTTIIDEAETRYTYLNRRSQMYGILSVMMDPSSNEEIFAIPSKYIELRRQLSLIPKLYDGEGRLYLPQKNKKGKSAEKTMRQILGCSPDELDSLVIACYCMVTKTTRRMIGAPQ